MSLKLKCESAWAKWIATLPGVPVIEDSDPATPAVYKGADTSVVGRDRVVVNYLGGPEDPQGSGNRRGKVAVMVVSGADPEDEEAAADALARHQRNCEAVFLAIETAIAAGTLAGTLSALEADFYIFTPVIDEGEDPDIEGRGWVESRIFTCYCCGVDIG
jgi:hypothetical protein